MQTFLTEIGTKLQGPITINCDNQGAIALTKDNKYHPHTKHIDIMYHFICKSIADDKVLVDYIPMVENTADVLTKPLAKTKLLWLVEWLGPRQG